MTVQKPIIIAGPCAAENEAQIMLSLTEAQKRAVDFVRISLWKPRTKPGFDGLGEAGIPLLVKAAQRGVNPGTEVIIPEHAEKVIAAVLSATQKGNVLIWIGARNQNHFIQQEIARIAATDKRVYLLVKNQPWHSEEHWLGIIEHVLAGGIDPEHLLLCHRGFSSPHMHNPFGYRNIPDYELAMKIRKATGLPMLFDPSHTGGSVDNVLRIAKEAVLHAFDGVIVEVHPDPKNAKTDAKQQLNWDQFDSILALKNYGVLSNSLPMQVT